MTCSTRGGGDRIVWDLLPESPVAIEGRSAYHSQSPFLMELNQFKGKDKSKFQGYSII